MMGMCQHPYEHLCNDANCDEKNNGKIGTITQNPHLIVMLTHNDQTVENAYEIFEQCKDSKAQYWGLKETGISPEAMKHLCSYIKSCGKTAVLEVVAYTEAECINGAKMAAECGFDILMGTLFYDSVNEICNACRLKYMPFVGNVKDRPSALDGTAEEMIDEANRCLKKGVFGFDLLGYRYTGDANRLIREFVAKVDAPVCIAGSIDNFAKLDEIKYSGAWALTIGGAFFENRFNGSFSEQVDQVYQYLCGNP